MNEEILKAVREVLSQPLPDEIAKAWTQSNSAVSGLTQYNLEAPAKTLYPVLTPIRNKVPRVTSQGGIQANWRAITGINVNNLAMGVSQGNRSGTIASSTKDYLAAFKGAGLEDYVTFEADYAAEGFDDVKARAVTGVLRSVMIGEEMIDIGGNATLALGTTPTPTLAASGSGGTLATQTLSVICVALAPDAYWAVAGQNNGATGQFFAGATSIVPGSVTRTNRDGSSDTYGGGSAAPSTNATVSVTGPNGSVTASVAAVTGAVAYAWFTGTAGSERLNSISTINSVTITAAANGGAQLASTLSGDNSRNTLIYDGILTQINTSGSGSYVAALATGTPGTGTKLTANGFGGISEFDTAFQQFWNLYRLSPDVIYVNAQQMKDITPKVANSSTPLIRFNMDANGEHSITGGLMVTSLINPITGQKVSVQVHPNIPPGTVLFWSDDIPYTLSGVANVVRKLLRRDYYQVEWPVTSRKYEYGVYFDGVLQNYFPPAFGILTNIAPG